MADPTVVDVPEKHRFEVRVDGDLAGFANYREEGERVVFTHTEIDDAFEGHGLGSVLAKAALDEMRERGRTVVPQCPFIAKWIERHPDYTDLVDDGAGA
jgi:predicted GNAT family acetyltransferase